MSTLTQLRNNYRVGGIALFDLVTAMLGTVLILLLAKRYHYPNLPTTNFILAGILLAIPLGIFVHIIFGVDTRLNRLLGLSN